MRDGLNTHFTGSGRPFLTAAYHQLATLDIPPGPLRKTLVHTRISPVRNTGLFVCALLLLSAPVVPLQATDTNLILSAWLSSQTNIQSWSADVIQTRTLKSLAQPLTATGQVWFAAPNRFRWELGKPPETIAVRSTNEMLVIYPLLKHVERYPLTGNQTGPWRDALALLEAGFPRSEAEMRSRLRIVSQVITNHTCELVLEPKSSAARRLMPQIKLAFDTNDFALKATEIQFADGSTMRNDFLNPIMNPRIDDKIFTPEIGPDYKIVEPLKQRK